MASRLMRNRSAIVAYMPSLRSVVRHFRAFSSYDERHPANDHAEPESLLEASNPEWPDPKLGPLGPQNKQFPFPGHSGPNISQRSPAQMDKPRPELDIFTEPLPEDRHIAVMEHVIRNAGMFQDGPEKTSSEACEDSDMTPLDMLECRAMECPKLIRKDFQDLFPDYNIGKGHLTVITISQKTENDQQVWSPDVEEEREDLLEHFISGASEICEAIQEAGFWADFIDPSAGRPYLGAYTNATLYETDERYRHFGFEIDDLGCCKVISHHLWGTHSYVGCLFTNAPMDHPVIQEMNRETDSDGE